MIDVQRLREATTYWNNEAATFDDEPDHGLRDPIVHQAWQALLTAYLPSTSVAVLDIGCGTGSLSVLLAQLEHTVTGVDLSPAMIEQAQFKAQVANQQIQFLVMDAAYPKLPAQQYDIILCRHILWSLPRPKDVLARWRNLLVSGGRFLLIEGYWSAGGGLHADDVTKAMPSSMHNVQVVNLSEQPDLWGSEVADERYLVVADNFNS